MEETSNDETQECGFSGLQSLETQPGASQRTGGSSEDHGQEKAWQVAFRALLEMLFD